MWNETRYRRVFLKRSSWCHSLAMFLSHWMMSHIVDRIIRKRLVRRYLPPLSSTLYCVVVVRNHTFNVRRIRRKNLIQASWNCNYIHQLVFYHTSPRDLLGTVSFLLVVIRWQLNANWFLIEIRKRSSSKFWDRMRCATFFSLLDKA